MFLPGTPFLQIIIRSVLVYFTLLIGLRLAGKREIGQMTVFDLVVLLLISNAVQNAMVGPDTSVTGGILAALVLLLINGTVAFLRLRLPVLRHLVEGTPTVLVMHGKTIDSNMKKEALDGETLQAALREHGFQNIEEIDMAVLEIDGSISVVPQQGQTKRIKRPVKFPRHQ